MAGTATVEVSNPVISTALSPGGFGLVHLGDVSVLARWKSFEGQIEMEFRTEALPPDRLRDLEHYRSSSRPLAVKLPGEGRAVNCVVKGFERVGNVATFYVSKVRPR